MHFRADAARDLLLGLLALHNGMINRDQLVAAFGAWNAGAGKAMGSVNDLAGAMKFVGPVAKNLNVSIEETTGVLAELAAQGIIGEQAGTSLRGVLLSLTSPSKIAAEELANLGINVYNSGGKFIGLAGRKAKDAVPALERMHDDPNPEVRKQAQAACDRIRGGGAPAAG